MKRIALIGTLALAAACDFPLVMVQIEAPEACVESLITVDAAMGPIDPYAYDSGGPVLPSELGNQITNATGEPTTIEDNFIDINEIDPDRQYEELLDFTLQFKSITLQAVDDPATVGVDESTSLDGVKEISIVLVSADPALPPWTVINYVRDPLAPAGSPIDFTGTEANLADYVYGGQLYFDIGLDVALPAGPYQIASKTCVKVSGTTEMTYNDAKTQFGF